MKSNHLLRILALVVMPVALVAQTAIHDATITGPATDPHSSAVLDVKSTDKGVLVPNVDIANLATAAPVTGPAEGLLVYNTNVGTGVGYYYWNGTSWVKLMSGNTTPLTGTGTADYLARWTSATNLGIGATRDNGTNVGFGVAPNASYRARVAGNVLVDGTGSTIGGSNLANASLLVGTSAVGIGMDPNELYFNGTDGNFGVLGANNLNINVNGGTRMTLHSTGVIRLNSYTTNGFVRTTAGNGTLTSGGAINLASEVTGILPIANGGTGSSTQGWVDLTTDQAANGIKTWGSQANFSDLLRASDGTAALPTYAFTSDPDNGMYLAGANDLRFSAAGGWRFRVLSGQVQVNGVARTSNGTAAAPAFSFTSSGNSNTGMFLPLATALGFATAGVERLRISATGTVQLNAYTTNGIVRTTAGNGTLTSGGAIDLTSEVTGVLPVANGGTGSSTQGWVDLTTAQAAAGNKTWSGVATFSNATAIRMSNGTAALPALSFTGDPNTGIYWHSADVLGFSTAGVEKMSIASNGDIELNNKIAIRSNDAWLRLNPTNAFTSGVYLANHIRVDGGISSGNIATPGAGAVTATAHVNSQVGFRISNGAANGTYLRGNGTNYVSSAIQAADIPTGSDNYIQNQTAAAQASSNYYISGYGRANDFRSSNGTAAAPSYRFASDTDIGMYRATTNTLAFSTAGTERMRIASNGNVGIGSTAPIRKLDIITGTASEGVVVRSSTTATNVAGHMWPGSGGFVIDARLGDLTGAANLHLRTGGSDRLYISGSNGNVGIGTTAPTYNLHVNGRIRSNAINETSDARLKKNVSSLNDPLEKVLAMRGVNYFWRTDEFPDMKLDSTLQFGLIAQELEKVVPELVSTDSEGWKSIEYSHIVPLLIEAIKELKQENNMLQETLSTLVSKVDGLSKDVRRAEVHSTRTDTQSETFIQQNH